MYRHYKGGSYELLHDDVTHSETAEEMVVYKQVLTGKLFVRPKKMFFEEVTLQDGEKVPRFEKLNNAKSELEGLPRC